MTLVMSVLFDLLVSLPFITIWIELCVESNESKARVMLYDDPGAIDGSVTEV